MCIRIIQVFHTYSSPFPIHHISFLLDQEQSLLRKTLISTKSLIHCKRKTQGSLTSAQIKINNNNNEKKQKEESHLLSRKVIKQLLPLPNPSPCMSKFGRRKIHIRTTKLSWKIHHHFPVIVSKKTV